MITLKSYIALCAAIAANIWLPAFCARADDEPKFEFDPQKRLVNDMKRIGKYFCVITHSVGFQTNDQTKERYAGLIRMKADEDKFFIEIKQKNIPKNEMIWHDKMCFGEKALENLKKIRESKPLSPINGDAFPDAGNYVQTCLDNVQLDIKNYFGQEKDLPFYADNYYQFRNFMGQFRVTGDHKFTWYVEGADTYLHEGICEQVSTEQPQADSHPPAAKPP